MSFTKSIKSTFPGVGHATGYGFQTNAAAPVTTTTYVINTNTQMASNNTITGVQVSPLTSAISNGKVRVRSFTVGTSATLKVGAITATDGTTTVQIYAGDTAASTAGNALEFCADFVTNLNLTSFSIPVTAAANACTVDIEVAGNL
jgi:hypothetical protein